ncbi:MAG: glycosyl transferase, partial [Gemmatimonadetes bacterium]|nr:glycosyl transferase [Gemmatimonadota bacterium]
MESVITALPKGDQPIRAEVFGIERLEQHAHTLAQAQGITDKPTKGRKLLPRVRDNWRALLASYRDIVAAVRDKREITQAEEWLLDNFFIVEEQLREVRDHLPSSFYRVLPKIAEGHLEGYPRVYGLVWAYVAHTDSRFELDTLRRFVRAYQGVQPLGIGELWAVTIHLRVVLLENLRRLSEQIIRSRRERARADEVADRLLGLGAGPPESVAQVLAGLGDAPLPSAFAVQLVQRLRDQPASIMPALDWLNANLAAQGTSANEVVIQAHQAQAGANITVRNIITSMRWISSIDWPDFFESISLVDEILRSVPGFAAMDFATRDKYRARVEALSRRSNRSEQEVAGEAVRLAGEARQQRQRASPGAGPNQESTTQGDEAGRREVPEHPEEDPGYYLVSRGSYALEKLIGYRVPWLVRMGRMFRGHVIGGYIGAIAAFTALILAGPLALTWNAGASVPVLILLGILALVPASDLAVSLVHRLLSTLITPRLLCKLELPEGVPEELRTMVVVPTLLTSHGDVEDLVERLEVHYLANPGGQLHFALLTDWKDASSEHMPDDEELLTGLGNGIARLNEQYGELPGGGVRFLALHRRRLWNEQEGKWISWERTRGKLHELNQLLRGATDTTFIAIDGQPPTVPAGVRFVITLDSDTRLPRATAYRLIGALAHPLNRPRFDPAVGRVVEGYAILQPRITASLPTGPGSTTYQRIVSGPGGVDPYGAAVSDVYQDLFGEGSYTGKGIYDVDAFEAALAGRVPDNALLSHDLFEGLFARAGLLTDVELFEEFPANYEVAVRRNHRWVRGDWQLLPWILGHARAWPEGTKPTSIPAHGRWKMVDNLRRSLFAPSAFLLAVAAWTLPGVSPLLWTGLILAALAAPPFIPVLDGLRPRRRGFSKRSYLRATAGDIRLALWQFLLAVTMLAHQAWLMMDAIVRTLGRLFFTRRHLLEWVPAAQAGYGVDPKLRAFYGHLRWGVVLAVAAGVLFIVFKPSAWPVATPLVLLWALSPVFAWRISVPVKLADGRRLTPAQAHALQLIARRTWRFFETFVTEEEHWLPPDNFQEDPEPVVARRTSPTNMGMYLLSTLVAHDFRWIGLVDMVDRLEATMTTMTTMRRFHGHFVNWYDTSDLSPMEPLYISTVDSGNLAGHLLALARGCRQIAPRPWPGPQVLEGIGDALQPVLDTLGQASF